MWSPMLAFIVTGMPAVGELALDGVALLERLEHHGDRRDALAALGR